MGEISTPKTENSMRVIDIISYLHPYLKKQFEVIGNKKNKRNTLEKTSKKLWFWI